jgi:hypothetical protein
MRVYEFHTQKNKSAHKLYKSFIKKNIHTKKKKRKCIILYTQIS